MEFTKVHADPRRTVWKGDNGTRVEIFPPMKKSQREKVFASPTLMGFQVDTVLAAQQAGAMAVSVKKIDGTWQ